MPGDSDLAAANIRQATEIHGQTGTVVETVVNCSSNGQQDCVVTGSYKAATTCAGDDSNCYVPTYAVTTQPLKAISYDAIENGKGSMLTSLTLSGIAGTYTPDFPDPANVRTIDTTDTDQGTLADCNSDGATGCVTTASYKSALISGAASKILSTETLAGVTGNVTLPAVGKVLDGISYGAGGTSMEGTLTLPAAANVLSGTDNYGDPASLLIPSLDSSGIKVRPAAPTITSAVFNVSPDNLTITWSSVADAAGYIVILNDSTDVSWVPTDIQTYTAGPQGSDVVVYVGSDTSYSYTGATITAGTTYSIAIYSYQVNKVYSNLPATKTVLSCADLAGGTWVAVPGDGVYGTSGFCVQKYIPSNVSGAPTSQTGTTPWVSINQDDARTACANIGAHLITNPEWMTIAANIASQDSNWSNGTVGDGTLSRGHSDTNPNQACAADASDLNGWVEGSCTGQTQGALAFNQRRTQNLSNGEVIWDIGGNVWQWIDYNNASDKPTPANAAWHEFTAMTGSTTTPMSHLVPLNSAQNWWDDTWNSTESIGKINPGTNGSGGALLRGASWIVGSDAGPFAVYLGYAPSLVSTGVSFRCARQP